jgi:hypothetical protein
MTVQRISYIQRISVFLGVLVLLLAAAPAAMGAAGAAQSAYDEAPPLGDVRGATADSGPQAEAVPTADTTPAVPVAEADTSAGLLPFTGLQIAIIFLLGIALVGTGLLIRRAARVAGD